MTTTIRRTRKAKVRSWRGRAAVYVLWEGVLLGITAMRADGHYSQMDLWAVGIFGGSAVAWLTAYAVLTVLLGALE